MKKKSPYGFSLLELIFALLILGVLTASSYPLYQQHIIRTHRMEAATALLHLAMKLESYYTLHDTYDGATFSNLDVDDVTKNNDYRLHISVNNNHYVLSAIPQNNQSSDVSCGQLTMDENGEKNISGYGRVNECWY